MGVNALNLMRFFNALTYKKYLRYYKAFGFLIATVSLVLFIMWFGWKIMLCVFLWTWGNNIGQRK